VIVFTPHSALFQINAWQVSGVAWFGCQLAVAAHGVRALVRARRKRRLRPRVTRRAGSPPHRSAMLAGA
jgi:hypothetical protein